jgi:hypothetical protein
MIRFDTLNLFFHPLPSGDYAIGIIYPAQRGFFSFLQPPKTFYVRVLIATPQTLLEKGNHPIALFDEFRHRHKIPLVSTPPKRLVPLVPLHTPATIDVKLLESLAQTCGAQNIARLVQSLFDAECTLFTSRPVSTLSVISALIDLLPLRYRTELTFSTDLFFSLRNPFRLIGCCGNPKRSVQYAKILGFPLIALESGDCKPMGDFDPWSRFVYQLFQTRNFSFLKQQFQNEYSNFVSSAGVAFWANIFWENLHDVGLSWSKTLLRGSAEPMILPRADQLSTHSVEELRCLTAVEQLIPLVEQEGKAAATKQRTVPKLAEQFPRFQKEMNALDSDIARAVFGDETVLSRIQTTWRSLESKLNWDEKDTVREEYIALIRTILVQTPESGDTQKLLRSSQLLDLMMIFLQTK